VFLDLPHQPVGEAVLVEVGEAGAGRDGEPRRNGEPDVRHLGEVGALPAEEILHVPVAFVEVVDELRAPR
jgi:hypothetical protein